MCCNVSNQILQYEKKFERNLNDIIKFKFKSFKKNLNFSLPKYMQVKCTTKIPHPFGIMLKNACYTVELKN